MKKLILLLIIPVLGFIISSCNSEDNPTTPVETKGSVYISSNPAGAQIWIDGINTSQVTPDTVTDVTEGSRNITLKLTDYKDTTFTLSVTAGQMSIVGPITLVSDIYTVFYGGQPIRIYETVGTDTTQPSGLDLSSGMRYGVSSSQKGLVDIYYSSNGFLVQSANLYPGLIRETDFYVGTSSDIYDGIDSPLSNTGAWTNNISDTETNYVFLYDHDGHYSKLRITGRGGGVPGVPAWVE
ncbi:MAG: PEGA domain-containing protein, partial [Ignavibacteriaceae bacterium]